MANTMYGCLGSDASPLRATPLQEAILRHGSFLCREAIALVEKEFGMDCIYG